MADDQSIFRSEITGAQHSEVGSHYAPGDVFTVSGELPTVLSYTEAAHGMRRCGVRSILSHTA